MSTLNKEQEKVCNNLSDNILLLAPAGTGKTNTLCKRVENILNKELCEAEKILCITFTNKACKEMKDRMEACLPKDKLPIIKTFHSLCFNIIKSEFKNSSEIPWDFTIYDEADCNSLLEEIVPDAFKMGNILALVSMFKEKMLSLNCSDYSLVNKNLLETSKKKLIALSYTAKTSSCDKAKWINFLDKLPRLVEVYNKRLLERHALDFSDLLIEASKLFENEDVVNRWRESFKYIHIDEVQDTNKSEYNLISKLFPGNIILMCGDKFQTIYEWRGSSPEKIFSSYIEKYSPVEIIFKKNYRATDVLLGASHEFLKGAFKEQSSILSKNSPDPMGNVKGDKIVVSNHFSQNSEENWIYKKIQSLNLKDFSKVCILTRSNKAATSISNVFVENNLENSKNPVPFLLVDEYKFFRRAEIKDLLSFLSFSSNKYDSNSLERILKKFFSGIGVNTLDKLTSNEMRKIGIRLTDFIDENLVYSRDIYSPLVDDIGNNNIIVFDTETTGVNVNSDEIIQVAATKINSNGEIVDKFVRFLKPTKPVGSSCAVHGFDDKFLDDNGEDPKTVLTEFLSFIEGYTIVGHNVNFDISILESYLNRLSLPKMNIKSYFDTLDIARRFYPELKNHKLLTLSDYFNTPSKPTHDALDDIKATGEVLLSMINGRCRKHSEDRRVIYKRYIEKFNASKIELNELYNLSFSKRPHEILSYIVDKFNVNKLYASSPQKLENIRTFISLVNEIDDRSMHPRDALIETLKVTSLSNSEIDRLLKGQSALPIITIHQSKGCEFDYVFIPFLSRGKIPSYRSILEGFEDEEKRLFYVAMTRAKKRLFFSYSGNSPSEFLKLIPDEYKMEE